MSNDFTYFERQKLEYLLRTKLSLRDIAKAIRRAHTIISREIRRNGTNRKRYRADVAQRLFEKRKHGKHKGRVEKNPKLKEYIVAGLKREWSPDEIAGRLKEEAKKETDGDTISHESIYQYIYNKADKWEKLFLLLPQRRPRRRKRGGRRHHKIRIPERKSIRFRPSVVNERKRFGDWESDNLEFKRDVTKGAISVQLERKSGLVRIHKVNGKKNPTDTLEALTKTRESMPDELFRTITFDNGFENFRHRELGIDTYFCKPFASWQKGSVENVNKLLRKYLPRSTKLDELTDYDIYSIQEKLNNRPRKRLNYQTPNEVIKNYLKSGAPKT